MQMNLPLLCGQTIRLHGYKLLNLKVPTSIRAIIKQVSIFIYNDIYRLIILDLLISLMKF